MLSKTVTPPLVLNSLFGDWRFVHLFSKYSERQKVISRKQGVNYEDGVSNNNNNN